MGGDIWSVLLILGPIALIAVIVWATLSNRKATPDAPRGVGAEPTVSATNAVRGSPDARPDLEAEAARAEAGADKR